MKCSRCNADSKYKDRIDGRCPACKRPFAFEPRRGDPYTDMAFKNAIDRVSANGRVRWNVDHLYYEICRRKRVRKTSGKGLALVVVVASLLVGAGYAIAAPFAYAGVLLVVAVLVRNVVVHYAYQRVRVDRKTFDGHWYRWTRFHGTPASLIERRVAPSRPRQAESDLPDYSFDRAVICDRPATVDLLLANNFHFENNCAVLSIGGYPEGPFETVRAMLKRNPRLQVFALHDATVEGCAMAHRLANDRAWFAGQARVTDVGLRPSQVGPFRGLYTAPPRAPGAAVRALARSERAWLSEHALELAAIRPEQVLKRLYRAVNRREELAAREHDSGDDDTFAVGDASSGSSGESPVAVFGEGGDFGGGGASDSFDVDVDSFGSDAGDSEGGADGFG